MITFGIYLKGIIGRKNLQDQLTLLEMKKKENHIKKLLTNIGDRKKTI